MLIVAIGWELVLLLGWARPVLAANTPGQLSDPKSSDIFCSGSGADKGAGARINTALGCIPVDLEQMLAEYLPYVFGIAGAISFLIMVYGFILMATSSGDPKAVQGAKETITSAITGLLVSIFAIFIIRLIILDVLVFPGAK